MRLDIVAFPLHFLKFTMPGSIKLDHFVNFQANANLGRSVPMWETRSVQITVQLSHDIAAQAEEVQKEDPEFLSRVVLYGLTRRSIYHQLRARSQEQTSENLPAPGPM